MNHCVKLQANVTVKRLDPSMLECELPFSNHASYFDGSRMAFLLWQAHVVTRTAFASFDTADHRIACLAFIGLAQGR